jgi:hypothetical protein
VLGQSHVGERGGHALIKVGEVGGERRRTGGELQIARVDGAAAVAMSNDKADFNSGSDTAYVAPSATTNPVPIDTSPTATVGRSASANTAQVINTEGGVCSGATLVVNAAADFSVEWTDLGAQATACNA